MHEHDALHALALAYLRPAPSDGVFRLGLPSELSEHEAERVVDFWRRAGPARWFAKDPSFDKLFRTRFAAAHHAAGKRELEHWLRAPSSALALILLLDQYPRNSFRGTPRMYATDALAREYAAAAIRFGLDRGVAPALRTFVYIPFSHSEALVDQQRALELFGALDERDLAHARGHHDIIARFGRFPHRNPILGRTTTAEEQAFLDAGGYAG